MQNPTSLALIVNAALAALFTMFSKQRSEKDLGTSVRVLSFVKVRADPARQYFSSPPVKNINLYIAYYIC